MQTVEVDIPEELLKLLKRCRLGARPVAEQMRVALAIHLLQEGVIQRTPPRRHEDMRGGAR